MPRDRHSDRGHVGHFSAGGETGNVLTREHKLRVEGAQTAKVRKGSNARQSEKGGPREGLVGVMFFKSRVGRSGVR